MAQAVNIALFASGNGTNVQAIIDAIRDRRLDAQVCALVCDESGAPVIDRAEEAGIATLVLPPKVAKNRDAWEEQMLDFVQEHQAELLVLAGFMRIVGKVLLEAYPNRIINIHPSLLPNFPGRHGIQDAYDAGVEETGVTIHYVDEGIDSGKIIRQEKIAIDPDWSVEELEKHIHEIEHRLYPETLQQLIEDEDMEG